VAVTICDTQGDGNIWVIDLAGKTKTQMTFAPGLNDHAVWWPDGKSIVFTTHRTGAPHIYRIPADGAGHEEKLLETPGVHEWATSVSPDGRYVAYNRIDIQEHGKRGYDAWALPMFGDHKPFSLVSTPFNETPSAISPDGKWLAYMSDETGQYEVYLKPFPSGEGKRQVSTSGGVRPHWRADSRELFFMNLEYAIMAVDVRENAGAVDLGTPHELFRADTVILAQGPYCVSPDGQKFLINQKTPISASQPFTLIANWTADLKK